MTKVPTHTNISSAPISEADRPPLRIWLVGTDALANAITQRWRSTSDQLLDIRRLDLSGFLAEPTCNADLVIFPASNLAETVERDWISPLPVQFRSPESQTGRTHFGWPIHWQKNVEYGKRIWGVPLGAPLPMIAMLEDSLPKDLSGIDVLTWQQLLAIKSPETKAGESSNTPHWSNSGDTWILDRFMLLHASLQPNANQFGSYFQISDMRPRLTDTGFVEAARLFSRLAAAFPDSWQMDPETAWGSVRDGRNAWGIGWPDLEHAPIDSGTAHDFDRIRHPEIAGQLVVRLPKADRSGLSSTASKNPVDSTIGLQLTQPIDSGRGLIIALGKKTRQSSTAAHFMQWLDADDQRGVLAMQSRSIASRSHETARSLEGRTDVDTYLRYCFSLWARPDVACELRLLGAERYRKRLNTALLAILQNPESVEAELANCSQDWERITEELGRQQVRRSLERCLNISD